MRFRLTALMGVSLAFLLLAAPLGQAQTQDPNPSAPDWLDLTYSLSITENLQQVLLDGSVAMHEAEATPDLRRACGETCTADELRDTYDRAGPSMRQQLVDGIEDIVEQEAEAALARIAGGQGGAQAEATVDESSLAEPSEGSPFFPPIPVAVEGSAPNGLLSSADYTDEQLDAIFRMGARVPVPIDETVEAGTNLTLSLEIPEPLAALSYSGAQASSTDQKVTWVVNNWKGEGPAALSDEVLIGRDDVVRPQSEDVDVDVLLDISSVDIRFGGLLGGGAPAEADVAIQVNATLRSLETPEDVAQSVELPYLSADALRIAMDSGLMDPRTLTAFEDEVRQNLRGAMANSFGADADVTGGFDADTLDTTAVGDPPGTGDPIELSMRTEATTPFPPPQNEGGQGVNAFEVTRLPVGTFQLPAIPVPGDRPATVTVLLPPGLDLAFEDATGGEVTRTETPEGRTAITFPSGSADQGAQIQGAEIVVEHPFVLNAFWPILLVLFLLLVVLPAAIILYVVLGRRREDDTYRDGPPEDDPWSSTEPSDAEAEASSPEQTDADTGREGSGSR